MVAIDSSTSIQRVPSVVRGAGSSVTVSRVPAVPRGFNSSVVDPLIPGVQEISNTVPPVINFITASGVIQPTDTIEVDVTDDTGAFTSITITATYSPSGSVQTVFDGASFPGLYATSTQTPIGGGGFRFELRQAAPGWWQDVVITVTAIDGNSNLSQSSRSFSVPAGGGPPGGGGPSANSPEVSNVSPNQLANLAPSATVQFDVTDDDDDIFRVMVFALFEDTGTYEVVHDSDNFSPRYTQGSRRDTITNGFRYTLRRVGGWPTGGTPLKLRVYAFDTTLNEL